MPIFAAAALPFTMSAIAAGATAGAGIYGANKQSSSADRAVAAQTDAANRAAELQAQSAREQLDFTKSEAARDQANYEATQRGNYDQWAAREGRISAAGQSMLGLPARTIAPYVASTASGTTPSGGAGATPAAGSGATWKAGDPIPKSTGNLEQDLQLANQIAYGGKGHVN